MFTPRPKRIDKALLVFLTLSTAIIAMTGFFPIPWYGRVGWVAATYLFNGALQALVVQEFRARIILGWWPYLVRLLFRREG